MNLPTNLFDENVNIQTFLCQPNKKIIGEIIPYDFSATFKFNTYSEISFAIDKYYNDLIEGKTKINPYYDLIESLRVIYLRGIGHFIIQDVSESESDTYTKSVTCFSFEYATGQKYLENFYVNTGEEGSIETMYHAQQYGAEYAIDNYYTLASKGKDNFDAYERYYIKKYINGGEISYNYVEVPILDADDYDKYKGTDSEMTLYVKKYPNVRFYWPTKPELSLLHNVFDRIPEWKIGHVDKELWYQERTFSEDRTAVYDFLYNTAAETLDFVMVWDSINGVCSFYKTTEDGMTTDNYVRTNTYNPGFIYYSDDKGTEANPQPKNENDVVNGFYYINTGKDIDTQWNTDVFISRENLASSLDIQYSTDDIKTKLKIIGSDGLDVRDVNLGQNYVLNLDYYIPRNEPSIWIDETLQEKYIKYMKKLTENVLQYKELVSIWSAAYNEYSDLMNYVPVNPSVLLIGDKFDKLHCVYSQYVPATKYVANEIYYSDMNGTIAEIPPNEDTDFKKEKYYIKDIKTQVTNLKNKLAIYQVDIKDGARSKSAKSDDVLLTLTNSDSDSITIRIRHDQEAETDVADKDYLVYRTYTSASTGLTNEVCFTLEEWVSGSLTANYTNSKYSMNADGFTVKSIGTLGAYFCIAKDETKEENISDYGIRLLEEKKKTYTQIFIAQTEGYMSREGFKCVASDEKPEGEIPPNTKWLDTDSDSLAMEVYDGTQWSSYNPENNQSDYENYARFFENYQKLQVVQKVLSEKSLKADYLLNGVAVDKFHLDKKNINFDNLASAVRYYFETKFNINKITFMKYDTVFGYLTFTVGSDEETEYIIYVNNGTPYIAYSRSQGMCLTKMNYLKEDSDMNNDENFSKQDLINLSPFIREDEFSDDNFLLTGYESEEEQMSIKQSLFDKGNEELKKICQPKLSFSATMANILAIPEFAPLRKQFKLGNFIKVGIREGYTKRARLLEVQINFDNPSDFSATFGDLISTRSEVDKHAELLQQAVTAGKAVASNQSKWQKGADKATELDQAINDGLRNASLSVGAANGQSIIWDQYGIRGRKLIDGTTDQYEDKQFALINNKLVFTDDNWQTSRAVVGEFEVELPVDGKMVTQNMYGLLADAIVGGYIQGTNIRGGTLTIGNKEKGSYFHVADDGSVSILVDGESTYAQKTELDVIDQAYRHSVSLSYDGTTVFASKDDTITTTITATVHERGQDITKNFEGQNAFSWIRSSSNAVQDTLWNKDHENQSNVLTISHKDVIENSHFSCKVDLEKQKS